MTSLGVPFDAIHTLILSHGHGDHAGQAQSVVDRSGARLVFHERETSYIGYPNVDEGDREQFVDWLRRYGYPEEEIAAIMATARTGTRGDRRDQPLRPDRELDGGEVLAIGRYRFEVLWTPGHTPGSICLLDRERRILLCGDHILEIVTPNVSLHPLLDENPLPGYLASLREFAGREIDLVLPGPRPPDRRPGARTAEIAQRHEDRRAQVVSLLTRVPQSAYDPGDAGLGEARSAELGDAPPALAAQRRGDDRGAPGAAGGERGRRHLPRGGRDAPLQPGPLSG